MSFQEISIAVRAENRASYAFRAIAGDATQLAYSFGLMDTQTHKVVSGIMAAIHLFTSLKAVLATATVAQSAHASATAANTTVQSANAGTCLASALAYKVHAAASWIATAAQNALNISYATFLALTGVGIAVIVAAAAAMWYFASQMNAATDSVKGFNAAASEVPTYGRGIRRAGEEEFYRRGVEA